MTTTVQVTIDGRILVLRGRNMLELATAEETRELIEYLTEALEQQTEISGESHA